MYNSYEEEEKKKKQQASQPTTTTTTTTNTPQTTAAKSTVQQYNPNNTVQTAQQNLATHTANKPAQYQSNWTSQLDGLMSQIMNREKFSYDMNADALYQQAKDMYTNQANMGMQNAMAQASALTGGYGSSYGQMVGQQAYAQQMQGLNDMLPELYQNALNQYINEGNELYNRYNMVANQENLDYGRYRDSMNDYLAERDYLNSIYNTEAERDYNRYLDERNYTYQTDRDAIADSRYEQEWAASEEQRLHDNAYQDKLFDYNASRDEAADAQWREQFEYGKEQDALAQENWYKQFEYAQEQDRLAQENWDKQFEYGKEQDALAQKNWQDQFEYGKTQDALNNQYRQDAFDYQKEQDKQSQNNWQAEFDRAGQQWDALYGEDGLYNKATPTTGIYNQGGTLQGQEVPLSLQSIPGLTTTDTSYFDENGNFKKAEVLGETNDDPPKISFRIDGKTVSLEKGINPYTRTYNKDCANGTFSNGYQPDNVNGSKLSKTGESEYVNGVLQNIWQDEEGYLWVWDGTQNKYIDVG